MCGGGGGRGRGRLGWGKKPTSHFLPPIFPSSSFGVIVDLTAKVYPPPPPSPPDLSLLQHTCIYLGENVILTKKTTTNPWWKLEGVEVEGRSKQCHTYNTSCYLATSEGYFIYFTTIFDTYIIGWACCWKNLKGGMWGGGRGGGRRNRLWGKKPTGPFHPQWKIWMGEETDSYTGSKLGHLG